MATTYGATGPNDYPSVNVTEITSGSWEVVAPADAKRPALIIQNQGPGTLYLGGHRVSDSGGRRGIKVAVDATYDHQLADGLCGYASGGDCTVVALQGRRKPCAG